MFDPVQPQTLFIPEVERIKRGIISGDLLTCHGNRYKKSSAYNYKQSIFWLRRYEERVGQIYLEEITIPWAYEFIKFLMDAGLSKNSISVIISRIKACLRRLFAEGVSGFNGSGICATGELTTAIYNSLEEIIHLWQLDLSAFPGLRRVRDIFILQCMTGLRVCDLQSLIENVWSYIKVEKGQRFFEINTQKTSTIVVVPISRIVDEILKSNNYDFGTIFSNQYYNLSIKELGRRAGIVQDVVTSRTQGGARVDRIFKKYQLMSSHTARRSFATNAFLAGLPVYNIMKITGHSTLTSFHRYIRCSSLEAALTIADHPFFTDPFGNIKNDFVGGGLKINDDQEMKKIITLSTLSELLMIARRAN